VRRRRWPAAAVVALALGASACSSGSSSTTAATPASVPATSPTVDSPPVVDQIAPAIAAVEAQLGGPQTYFEVNATSRLVNVIVALNNATLAQSWVYLDGQLSSKPAESAQGNTFTAAAVAFDPATILSNVRRDLASSSIDLFFVEGGPAGSVRYTAVVTSPAGGQLQVILAPDGTVQQVDPS
jgi:hypothetical protein